MSAVVQTLTVSSTRSWDHAALGQLGLQPLSSVSVYHVADRARTSAIAPDDSTIVRLLLFADEKSLAALVLQPPLVWQAKPQSPCFQLVVAQWQWRLYW